MKPTASLSGPIAAYLQLLASEDKGAALINSDVAFSGNSQSLVDLQSALAELELDWESQLAPVIGDIPSHLLGKGVRHALKFGQRAASSFGRHLEEYLHEEARLLPCREEVEDFFDDIAQLKERSDRLEARLQRLQQQLKSS